MNLSSNSPVISGGTTATNVTRIRGKTIVIDPGHSGDPGAIGPTGYTEAQANLELALVLK
jgi:N-acetylmuramoyl-L-alanine amidase